MLHKSDDFLCGYLLGAQGNPGRTPEDMAHPAVVGIAECELLPPYLLLLIILIEDSIEDL